MRCEIGQAHPADAGGFAQVVARALAEASSEAALRRALEQGICRAVAARDSRGGVKGFVLGRRALEEVQIALVAVDPDCEDALLLRSAL